MTSHDPYQVVRDFEKALAEYTGAPYVVTVDSCTNALFLCLKYMKSIKGTWDFVEIPKRTYLSVPMQIIHAGYKVRFREENWHGAYWLAPLPISDSAKRFTGGMFPSPLFECLSFHWQKILAIGRGGAILTDNGEAAAWFRRARFDGRTEGVDPKDDQVMMGYHMYLTPELAAAGLVRMSFLPKDNLDQPCDDYPDLSKMEIFK